MLVAFLHRRGEVQKIVNLRLMMHLHWQHPGLRTDVINAVGIGIGLPMFDIAESAQATLA